MNLPVPAAMAGTLIAAGVGLAGCGFQGAGPAAPTAVPTPAATASPDIGFAVVVTPLRKPTSTGTPAPTPTPYAVPRGPYIQLIPSTGPPVSRTLMVRGGHLPPSVGVRLGWSSTGNAAPVTTGAGTDEHGRLLTRFTVPASPPGRYTVVLTVGGVRYAVAKYLVASAAVLHARVVSSGKGDLMRVRGAGFVPRLKLLLVAYPIDVRGKPVVVGTARCGARGSFRYSQTVPHLALGQYLIRAWSDDAMAAQMAEAYFQVVI